MADVVESDLTKGPEVKIYAGGELAQLTKTISSAEASAGGFDLGSYKADYGLLVGTVDGAVTAFTGFAADGTTPATEASGIEFVKYAGIAQDDVVVLNFIDVDTVALTQISSCKDVKTSTKADSSKTAVHGQANKITSVGTQETSGSFEMLLVNTAIKTMFLGDQVTGSPKTGETVWTNKYQGFKSVGCIVGKKVNTSGVVTKKFAMCGVKANSLDKNMPTEDFYSESFNVDIDYLIEWAAAAS